MNLHPSKVAEFCIKWLLSVVKKEETKRRIFLCFVLFIIVFFVLIHTIIWVKSNRGILTWYDASLQYRYTQSLADMMDAGNSFREIAFYIKENVKWPAGVLLLRSFSMHLFEWQDVRLCNLVDCFALIIIILLSYYHFRKDIGNWALLISLFISTSLIYAVKEPFLDVWFAAFALLTISAMGFYQDRRTYALAALSGLFLGLSFLIKPAAGPLLIVPCVTLVLLVLTTATGRLERLTVVKHILCFSFVCLVTFLPYYVYTYPTVSFPRSISSNMATHTLFAAFQPFGVLREHFTTPKLFSKKCLELVFNGFAGRFNQQFFSLPVCAFAFGGVVWSLLKRNTRNCFLNASFVIPGTLYLMWICMGSEMYTQLRLYFPFLPFYFYYGILWVRSWRPRSLRVAGLILFLSITLYPVAYVTADCFSIKIPDSLKIGVKRKRLFGMNLPSSFNKDGFSLTTGCIYSRFYSFASLQDHPWLWLWNVGDDIKSLQGSVSAHIAVIDLNWAPSTYLFRRKFKYGNRQVYRKDLLKEKPLKAEFVLLHMRDRDLVPNSYYFLQKYKQGEYLLYSKKHLNSDYLVEEIRTAESLYELDKIKDRYHFLWARFPKVESLLKKSIFEKIYPYPWPVSRKAAETLVLALEQSENGREGLWKNTILKEIQSSGCDPFKLYKLMEPLRKSYQSTWSSLNELFQALCSLQKVKYTIGESLGIIDLRCNKIANGKYRIMFLFRAEKKIRRDLKIRLHAWPSKEDINLLPTEKNRESGYVIWYIYPTINTRKWHESKYVIVESDIETLPLKCSKVYMALYNDGGRFGDKVSLPLVFPK